MSCSRTLSLNPRTRRDVTNRMRSIRGHLEGVLRMLEDESRPAPYCVDVLKQLKAVQGALERVSETILLSHLRDHMATASVRGDTDQLIEELLEVLKYRP